MSTPSLSIGGLTDAQVDEVLAAAAAAPSMHNSQPWRLECSTTRWELHADHARCLPAADPDHREMLLACGAALLNLRLAIRAFGVAADIRSMPDPSSPTLLAVIRPQGTVAPTDLDKTLAAAIFRRHTNRRPFLDRAVPLALCGALRHAARSEQAWLALLPPATHSELRAVIDAADRTQRADAQFLGEWRKWTGRSADSVGGVPVAHSGIMTAGKDLESNTMVAVIGSFDDSPLAQLRAGQAMQRVLVTATLQGLSASFLSQIVEVPQARRQVRTLIGGGLWPQAVLQLGYGLPAPTIGRRKISEWAGSTAGSSPVGSQ